MPLFIYFFVKHCIGLAYKETVILILAIKKNIYERDQMKLSM